MLCLMNNLHYSPQLTMSKEQKDEQKNKPTLWEIIGVPIVLGCLLLVGLLLGVLVCGCLSE